MGGCTSKDKTVAENEGCVIFFHSFLSLDFSGVFDCGLFSLHEALMMIMTVSSWWWENTNVLLLCRKNRCVSEWECRWWRTISDDRSTNINKLPVLIYHCATCSKCFSYLMSSDIKKKLKSQAQLTTDKNFRRWNQNSFQCHKLLGTSYDWRKKVSDKKRYVDILTVKFDCHWSRSFSFVLAHVHYAKVEKNEAQLSCCFSLPRVFYFRLLCD